MAAEEPTCLVGRLCQSVLAEETLADVRPVLVDGASSFGEELTAVLDDQTAVPREGEMEPGGSEIPESLVFVPGKVDARK